MIWGIIQMIVGGDDVEKYKLLYFLYMVYRVGNIIYLICCGDGDDGDLWGW